MTSLGILSSGFQSFPLPPLSIKKMANFAYLFINLKNWWVLRNPWNPCQRSHCWKLMLDWNMNNCQTLIKQCNANVLHVNSMTYMSWRGNKGDLTHQPLKRENQSASVQFLVIQGSLKREKSGWWGLLNKNAHFYNLWNIFLLGKMQFLCYFHQFAPF